MISGFSFPTKIRFGAGALAELPGHLASLNSRKPLIVTDPGLLPTNAFKALSAVSGGAWPVFSGMECGKGANPRRSNPSGNQPHDKTTAKGLLSKII